jgi:hypothetical protein
MKAFGGVDSRPSFLHLGTSLTLCVQLYTLGALTPRRKASGTERIRGSVGPWAGLDDTKKLLFFNLPCLKLQSFGRRSRSQSLYRLRYRQRLLYYIITWVDRGTVQQHPIKWLQGALSRGGESAGAWYWPLTSTWSRGQENVYLHIQSNMSSWRSV